MATPRVGDKLESEYMGKFSPRRVPRQVPKRPSSGTRKNNPHPIKDFLLYNLNSSTPQDELHSKLRSAILVSASVDPGGRLDLNSIPLGPLANAEEEENQISQLPLTEKPEYLTSRDLCPQSAKSARHPGEKGTLLITGDLSRELEKMATKADRTVIMNRGLSPRRAAPPRIPGRTLAHYGSFGNREDPNPYIGGLDLHASPYNANRGFNQGFTTYSSRESRPMHRHQPRVKKGEDYLHNNSVYYSTTPNVTGYFIIHPDWVSERLSLRRSQSLLSF